MRFFGGCCFAEREFLELGLEGDGAARRRRSLFDLADLRDDSEGSVARFPLGGATLEGVLLRVRGGRLRQALVGLARDRGLDLLLGGLWLGGLCVGSGNHALAAWELIGAEDF